MSTPQPQGRPRVALPGPNNSADLADWRRRVTPHVIRSARGFDIDAVDENDPFEIDDQATHPSTHRSVVSTGDMRRVFPREWDVFAAAVPAHERDEGLAAAYARLLANPDPVVTEQAALSWCVWEDTHVSLAPGFEPWLQHADSTFRQVFARLVTHYWANGCFLDDAPILAGMDRIAEIPAVLIHGRYDVSGPLDTAWDLHRAWPASRLVVLEDAGHGGDSMTSAIIDALSQPA
jgi:proline iminopeptidase